MITARVYDDYNFIALQDLDTDAEFLKTGPGSESRFRNQVKNGTPIPSTTWDPDPRFRFGFQVASIPDSRFHFGFQVASIPDSRFHFDFHGTPIPDSRFQKRFQVASIPDPRFLFWIPTQREFFATRNI